MTKRIDLTWKRFGRLLVLWYSHSVRYNNRTYAYWKCNCDCGNECVKKGELLKNGGVKSCWCLRKEINITHWMWHNRFNNIWRWIKTRCYNPKTHIYKYYWWRGIKMCKERLHFEKFRDDMYESYLEHCEEFWTKDTTIDRFPNIDWNYCKENCRWATHKEQEQNKKIHFIR